jgi:hypothetical protein
MKKSNVRFFHGEPTFPANGLCSFRTDKMHKYAFPTSHIPHYTFLVKLVQLVQPLLSHTHARVGVIISY